MIGYKYEILTLNTRIAEDLNLELDKKYLKIAVYVLGTLATAYIMYEILKNIAVIGSTLVLILGAIISVLKPLIFGLILMYLLYPAVLKIEATLKKRIKYFENKKRVRLCRTVSLISVYLIVVLIIFGLLLLIYKLIVGGSGAVMKAKSFPDEITSYINMYNQIFAKFSAKLNELGLSDQFKAQSTDIVNKTKDLVGSAISGFFSFLGALGGNLINFFLGILISFYLIFDLKYFRKVALSILGLIGFKSMSDRSKRVLSEINDVISGFIRGQLLDAFIVGILCTIGFSIIGLDFSLILGSLAGIGNIIPYFGMLIAMISAIIVALLSGSLIKAVLAILVIVTIQQIDTMFITPRVVGKSVGLHPVFVILSIIIAGTFFGLLGMLLAVPASAIIKLLFNEYIMSKNEEDEVSL